MNKYIIKQLKEENLNDYRDIRLELLKTEPQNFGSSFEDEQKFEMQRWIERIIKSNILTLGAFHNEILVGICLVVYNLRTKTKHVADINSMYVKKEYRNQGIAKQLIDQSLEACKSKGIEIVNLSVVTINDTAFNLYKQLGFKVYGEEPRTIKHKNKYYSLYLMSKNI
ncbi:MAG: GNAT family N-acetyltransferase [Tenericutes bacterium]|nr:GNAT family N-acetyltransferase [Mycoplasmatota bacterium]